MNKEIIILSSIWIVMALMLFLFVPRNKLREAIVIFFFKQFLTWAIGLAVVQFGLIEYPVRMFANATKSSFDYEFFFYPSTCVVFNLHYPEGKGRLHEFMYFFYYCSIMTIVEVLAERYTNILNYIHWTWYITWITLFITFYLSRKFYVWYFRLKPNSHL
ncbi:MAG TPA: CBO0543 family protein [Bacillota bacterium]|nr:CBO0543 family protein [Bacillota bacterium]